MFETGLTDSKSCFRIRGSSNIIIRILHKRTEKILPKNIELLSFQVSTVFHHCNHAKGKTFLAENRHQTKLIARKSCRNRTVNLTLSSFADKTFRSPDPS